MPFVNNQGVRIHYQVTGDGPPLILQHGFSGSLMDWHEFGYVEKLQNHHRLILVDARGHGTSDKLHKLEDYSLSYLVSDITTVLDDLHIKKINYWGYSMGGWIGYGMARYASHHLNSLIVGGAQPYGRSFENARKILRNGLESWMKLVEGWGIYSSDALARVRKNDVKALLAIIQDRPDMSKDLLDFTLPCLLYAGGNDDQHEPMEHFAKELSHASFVSFPQLDHFQIFPRSDLITPHIVRFLASLY